MTARTPLCAVDGCDGHGQQPVRIPVRGIRWPHVVKVCTNCLDRATGLTLDITQPQQEVKAS